MAGDWNYARGALVLAAIAIVGVVVVEAVRSDDRVLGELEPMPEPTAEQRFVETTRGTKVWPASAPLVEGVGYRYNTGHCGLDFMADFDGSFWRPFLPEGEKVPDFFISEEEGLLRVLTHDRALFRATDGTTVMLTRHDGPILLKELCD